MQSKGSKINAVRGMHDVLPPASFLWQWLEEKTRSVFARFGFAEIRTPIVEETELFSRSIGEVTDIVEKEMYTFLDRNEKSLTLRPEGTASVVRALLEAGWLSASTEQGPLHRLYYLGPMFRYERPQKGRQRQFYQLGAEVFGDASPYMDVEVLSLGSLLFEELGLKSMVTLEINSLGTQESRAKYIAALKKHLEKLNEKGGLCGDCQRRLHANPLRVLDCKNSNCAVAKGEIKGEPKILDFLVDKDQKHFERVQKGLDSLKVPYKINTRLVRGLDYYTQTAFEFVTTELGAQGAVIAGGRYDNLVSELGGPAVPAIGFAGGIERLVLLLEKVNQPAAISKPQLYLAGVGDEVLNLILKLNQELRQAGVHAQTDFRGKSLKAHFKQADRLGAQYVLILGENELAQKKVPLKNMADGSQTELAFTHESDLTRKLLQTLKP